MFWITLILALIAGCAEGLWRRWFGGYDWGVDEKKHPIWYKIIDSRGTQTAVNFVLLGLIFWFNDFWASTPLSAWLIAKWSWMYWVILAYLAIIWQLQFWSRQHGPAFDCSRGGAEPDEHLKERYRFAWWCNIVFKIVPEEGWYLFICDFLWMTIRYSIYTLWVIPFLWTLSPLWLGIIVASIYSWCWTVSERDSWIYKRLPPCCQSPTNMGEILAGFTVAMWLMLMNLG